MPTAKKSTKKKPAATKKAAAKKTKPAPAPKAVAPEAAAPAPKAPAPPAIKHRVLELETNAGAYKLNFVDDSTFEAAMAIVNSTPSTSGGSRTTINRTIYSPGQKCSFKTIQYYKVHEL
tara:strand:- start:90 stop:446 length:357 start_codon:yes stop_codon:yes gene_type:complete